MKNENSTAQHYLDPCISCLLKHIFQKHSLLKAVLKSSLLKAVALPTLYEKRGINTGRLPPL